MVESAVLLLGHQQIVLKQHALRHRVRLGQDNVVLAREQLKGKLQKVLASTREPLVNAKQIDHEGVYLLFGYLWHLLQTSEILNQMLVDGGIPDLDHLLLLETALCLLGLNGGLHSGVQSQTVDVAQSLHHEDEVVLFLKRRVELPERHKFLHHVDGLGLFLLETELLGLALLVLVVLGLGHHLNHVLLRHHVPVALQHARHVLHHRHRDLKTHFVQQRTQRVQVLSQIVVHLPVLVREQLDDLLTRLLHFLGE